ncbi:MAG TPA: dihydroorotase [Fibrobacteria bacterium]|jgi:dihydroorotase|nr:dihydroorotase [Fibrobacteria bacterium]
MSVTPSSRSLLIRGAQVVSSQGILRADVRAEDGVTVEVAPDLAPRAGEQVIDAAGLHLFPGIIDPQCHFREPGNTHKEDLESGSRAAAAGGVTSFLEMPNTNPPGTTAAMIRDKYALASTKCHVDFGFFIGATPDNLHELNSCPEACGIKVFMGSSTGTLLVSERPDLERIFGNGRKLIAVHAEDDAIIKANKERFGDKATLQDHPFIRSPEAALKATTLAVELSKKYNRRLHILHTTTEEEADFLRKEKVEGLISAEVCPQHFLLIAPEVYDKLGTYAQMNPPLREARHGKALWKALVDGVIDCTATDHAPHTREEKDKGYPLAPAGMPGVETLFPLMLDRALGGLCSLTDLAKWMSEAPARLYAMVGKGKVAAGFDADYTLVDTATSRTIHNGQLQTRVNWSPYDGWTLKGAVKKTIVRGGMAYDEGAAEKFATPGWGRPIRFDASWEK